MKSTRRMRLTRMSVAAVAILFGVATIFAGGRVLLGSDPGYIVYRPLLVYNMAMGAVYLAVGIAVWRTVPWAKHAAAGIFGLNLVVLVGIILVYRSGGAVAVDSLRAMTLRTVVWLGLFLTVWWLHRSRIAA